MAKQRVYELARDLGLESKDVLERAQELGVEVKTASSGLDEDSVALVRMSYEEVAGRQSPVASPESEEEESEEAEPEEAEPEEAASDQL
ncbi:MAG: translation initiation factor IF-2 N-terminal domain-containing protein, partial [Actinomycetota bacterium]|nr:translation initiation factor IF-2 N-terminal domain-containing protein [Actinomycetota bacterium]